MYITTFFTENNSPKTGLSPTIRIRKLSDNSLVITDAAMTEVGDGIYKYNFSVYDESIDYVFRVDAATDSVDSRYQFGSNNTQILEERTTSIKAKTDTIDWTDIDFIRAIEGGRWRIVSNQMIFYAEDNTTVTATFNLLDSVGAATSTDVAERVRV